MDISEVRFLVIRTRAKVNISFETFKYNDLTYKWRSASLCRETSFANGTEQVIVFIVDFLVKRNFVIFAIIFHRDDS